MKCRGREVDSEWKRPDRDERGGVREDDPERKAGRVRDAIARRGRNEFERIAEHHVASRERCVEREDRSAQQRGDDGNRWHMTRMAEIGAQRQCFARGNKTG